MSPGPELLLIGAVAAVGVLHTIVPDHWVPITLIARQRGWSRGETARAALQAGTGHVLSTLLIAVVVWLAGVAVAARFGQALDTAASLALIGFGGWIAFAAWRALHGQDGHGHHHHHHHGHRHHDHGRHDHDHDHEHHDHHDDHHHHDHDEGPDPARDPLYAPLRGEVALLTRHTHLHRHRSGVPHLHWHDHLPETAHAVDAGIAVAPPAHAHRHKTNLRTALVLILGSSPMIEGIPAFFAAGKYGWPLIVAMSLVFAASTVLTYLLLCLFSSAGLERVRLGALERYGEVLSGVVIAAIGVAFWLWPVL